MMEIPPMPELAFHLAGWVGTFLTLLAYVLVSFKKIDVISRTYQWLNLLGAVCLAAYVLNQHAWPALLLEVVWGSIAIVALIKVKRGAQ